MSRRITAAREKARSAGIPHWQTLQASTREGKRFAIRGPAGGMVHFGQWPVAKGTYLDHSDRDLRAAWRARHRTIKSGAGPAWQKVGSPAYYSWHILW